MSGFCFFVFFFYDSSLRSDLTNLTKRKKKKEKHPSASAGELRAKLGLCPRIAEMRDAQALNSSFSLSSRASWVFLLR